MPKSPAKSKNSTPVKNIKINDKTSKKTPIKESAADKKTPVKTPNMENKTVKNTDKKSPVKSSNEEKKTPVKNGSSDKNTLAKNTNGLNKTPVKSSPEKNRSTDLSKITASGNKRGKREGLPISRVRTIMKTARYAEAISPDAVQLTAIAAELFIKYLMQGVYTDVTKMKKRKIEYNALANYINSEDEEHLQFLKVLIPHKITVAEYKKMMAESSKKTDRLDFLASESEESGSEEDSESEESSEEDEEEDSDIEEIPTPQKKTTSPKKTVASPKKTPTKKGGKPETVDLCGSSSEEDFIILDNSKKEIGESSKNVTVL
ncbi:hypothetical protein M8J75_015935 [Diaphorina citri]|nr:hypothetical protein M8J75_015935 [Diaphorina citri]